MLTNILLYPFPIFRMALNKHGINAMLISFRVFLQVMHVCVWGGGAHAVKGVEHLRIQMKDSGTSFYYQHEGWPPAYTPCLQQHLTSPHTAMPVRAHLGSPHTNFWHRFKSITLKFKITSQTRSIFDQSKDGLHQRKRSEAPHDI